MINYEIFIFARCRHSLAVVTSGKYEYDSKAIACISASKQFSLMENLMNRTIVTLTRVDTFASAALVQNNL